jgi:tellurite resistance protein TerC
MGEFSTYHVPCMDLRKAIYWSIFWIGLSLLVNAGLWFVEGHEVALQFFTGYVIEKSLSVDNLFVFLLIFSMFDVPLHAQRRVLNYGIIGVILLRGILIFVGTSLVQEFHWIMYAFGAFLIYTAFHIVFGEEKKIDVSNNWLLRAARRAMPVADSYHGERFFVKPGGKLHATPMLMVLLVIETTDLAFAVDSIPAIFAITTNPFIVFGSNIMAVLGLRSLYFVLVELQRIFVYIKYGIGIVLGFVGLKMVFMDAIEIPTVLSLGIITFVLTASVAASSIIRPKGSK